MKHAFRLHPGDDLKQSLQQYAEQHQIVSGFVVTCVGSISTAVLRMAGAKTTKTFTGKHEIVSLVGTVSIHGSHIHLAISDEAGQVFGGHLKDGTVIETTAEIILNDVADKVFTRQPDATTGYDELVITDR